MESRRRRVATGLLIAAIGLMGMGCFERQLRPVNPCTRSNVGETIRVESVDEVDLLFMIDNSNSMAEEQVSLTRELPRMVRVLASGDRDGDGEREFTPVRSLHIGIVTSDMGTGSFMVPTCDRGTFGTRFGDDGILIGRGRTSIPGCMATYPRIFEFQREGAQTADDFANEVACVATTGTGGCGFEQQLEAVLKALSPSAPQSWTTADYDPPIFVEGTFGHADSTDPMTGNGGFIRENSALAIIMVTDEEDCSVINPDLFNPSSPTFGGTDLNLRCFTYPEVVHPVERYVRGINGRGGLINLRQNPALLIFGAIIGIPVSLSGSTDYAGILAHPDMVEMVDPAMPTRLRPSCNDPARGIAFPPRRIVRTAQALDAAGASVTVQSICQESFTGALDTIIEKIANALGGACLPRDLNPDAEGFVGCDVFEVLPVTGPITSCDGLPGREPVGEVDVDGVLRQMCRVAQVGPGGASAGDAGWFYETAEMMRSGSDLSMLCGASGQRISFANIQPTTNADIRLECLQTVTPSTGGDVGLGTFCDPAATPDICSTGRAPDRMSTLTCDAADRTCGFPCTDSADCTSAGLLSEVCDTRSWREAVGADDPSISEEEANRRLQAVPAGTSPDDPHGFCVNPTCI